MKPMSLWGIGPLWGTLVLSYGLPVTWVSRHFSILRIPSRFSAQASLIGLAFLAIGIPYLVKSVRAILGGFREGKLLTEGVYAACRHPVYSAWVVFIIPGIALLLHSWLSLSTILVAVVSLRLLVRKEEQYLEERFGEEYRRYKEGTPFILPIGHFLENVPGSGAPDHD